MSDDDLRKVLDGVHAGFLMDQDDEFCQTNAIRAVAEAAAKAERDRLLPGGWLFHRNPDESITVTNAEGMGVVVHRRSIGPREIPEEVLHALASALAA